MPEKETSKYKLPYPTSAGEVKNGAKDIEELAVKLDTVLFSGNKVAAEQVYGSKEMRTVNTEYEESATRPALVVVRFFFGEISSGTNSVNVVVGGINIGEIENGVLKATSVNAFTFVCPAGAKWKWEAGVATVASAGSRTLLL